MQELMASSTIVPQATTLRPWYGSKPAIATIATGVALTAVLVWALLYLTASPTPSEAPVLYSSALQPDSLQLIDGSTLYLDSHTQIKGTLGGSTHQMPDASLTIQGAVYVKSGKSAPKLQAGQLIVPPSAGRYFISYDSASGWATVQVQSGQATVRWQGRSFSLTAGQALRHQVGNSKPPQPFKANANQFGYATHYFEFENTPLAEVLPILAHAYTVKFTVTNDRLYNCRITTRFDQLALPELLQILAATLNLEFETAPNGQSIAISGHGCD